MMPILLLLVAPQTVVTTGGDINDDKVGVMTILGFSLSCAKYQKVRRDVDETGRYWRYSGHDFKWHGDIRHCFTFILVKATNTKFLDKVTYITYNL